MTNDEVLKNKSSHSYEQRIERIFLRLFIEVFNKVNMSIFEKDKLIFKVILMKAKLESVNKEVFGDLIEILFKQKKQDLQEDALLNYI